MAEEIFRTAFRTYNVVRQLGQGGAGRVFEVQSDDGAHFALKLLNEANLTSDRIKRFRNEIAFCQRRVHPGIIQVVDVGFIGANSHVVPFYVMPLYEKTLRQVISDGVEAKRAVNLFMQVVDAVSAAHENGVSHRDLKPENILITVDGDAVVADFGIARFDERNAATMVATKAGTRLANFQYAAPEQRKLKGEVTDRADVYSLGLIGQELLTGEIPLGEGAKSVLDSSPDLSFLDAILRSMRQQNPENRPSLASVIGQVREQLPDKSQRMPEGSPVEEKREASGLLAQEAARLGAKHRHEKTRKEFFHSHQGVDRVRKSFDSIRDRLKALAAELSELLPFAVRAKEVREYLEVKSEGYSAVPLLRVSYANSLEGVKLRFIIWRGDANLPGRNFFDEPEEVKTIEFSPDLDAGDVLVWRRGDGLLLYQEDGVLSENDVAQEMMLSMMQVIESNLGQRR